MQRIKETVKTFAEIRKIEKTLRWYDKEGERGEVEELATPNASSAQLEGVQAEDAVYKTSSAYSAVYDDEISLREGGPHAER